MTLCWRLLKPQKGKGKTDLALETLRTASRVTFQMWGQALNPSLLTFTHITVLLEWNSSSWWKCSVLSRAAAINHV